MGSATFESERWMRAESRAPEIAAPALAVRDVRKRFGAIEAVNGASFDLRAGERLALLGPNGAGKTTLIRAIAGRVRPDAGSIELMGVPLVPGSVRAELGIVPQEIALYDRLTARENLMAFGRFAGIAPTDLRERVAWALDWTGLVDRAEHQVGTFSGGMKRRVNIAAGVLHRPRVILLDEPTVGVDPQSRERIYDMLDRLRDDGASILLTTHQLEEAEVRCDRIIIYERWRNCSREPSGPRAGWRSRWNPGPTPRPTDSNSIRPAAG
jgi:ABC-2 type transport system ATP-binding protein